MVIAWGKHTAWLRGIAAASATPIAHYKQTHLDKDKLSGEKS